MWDLTRNLLKRNGLDIWMLCKLTVFILAQKVKFYFGGQRSHLKIFSIWLKNMAEKVWFRYQLQWDKSLWSINLGFNLESYIFMFDKYDFKIGVHTCFIFVLVKRFLIFSNPGHTVPPPPLFPLLVTISCKRKGLIGPSWPFDWGRWRGRWKGRGRWKMEGDWYQEIGISLLETIILSRKTWCLIFMPLF